MKRTKDKQRKFAQEDKRDAAGHRNADVITTNESDGETAKLAYLVRDTTGRAHRGQKSIPLPLVSFVVVFVPPPPGTPPPPADASPENGLRCGAAFAC